MSERDWFGSQLDRAKAEVQTWDAWKQGAMRQSASSNPEQTARPSSEMPPKVEKPSA